MELFLLRGTSFVESVADGFVQDCSSHAIVKLRLRICTREKGWQDIVDFIGLVFAYAVYTLCLTSNYEKIPLFCKYELLIRTRKPSVLTFA